MTLDLHQQEVLTSHQAISGMKLGVVPSEQLLVEMVSHSQAVGTTRRTLDLLRLSPRLALLCMWWPRSRASLMICCEQTSVTVRVDTPFGSRVQFSTGTGVSQMDWTAPALDCNAEDQPRKGRNEQQQTPQGSKKRGQQTTGQRRRKALKRAKVQLADVSRIPYSMARYSGNC